MSIVLSGKLSFTPLAESLEQLRGKNATGTLTVRCGDTVKIIYIKDGQIIFASSTVVDDRLGEILVKAGKLTRDNLEQALQAYKKSVGIKKLGAILVEQGFVSPRDLFAALKTQVKDIIYSLFLLAEGEYQFEDCLPPDILQLQINFESLIAEIIQRMKQDA